MMDDLINKEITEPYRLMTARSEYRLLLRTDNADLRLSEIGHEIGLLSDDQYIGFVEYKKQLSVVRDQLSVYKLKPCRSVNMKLGRVDPALKLRQTISYTEFLRRPQASMTLLKKMVPDISTSLTDKAVVSLRQAQADIAGRMEAVLRELEIQIKYEGYIGKQEELVEKFNRMENKKIPAEFDYDAVVGLRTEARQVLKRVKPLSLGQASRLSGVNPSDVAVLMVRMK